MASYVIDSEIFRDWFGTVEARSIFSDESMVQYWLDFEAALAQAQAEVGIIPVKAAEEIIRKSNIKNIDMKRLKERLDKCGHPIVPFIGEFKSICDDDAGQYFHYATTTQDTMDTAMVLQIKAIYDLILGRLKTLRDNCRNIALENKNVCMAGRTHGQHALPITMGYKAAVWVSELNRDIKRLEACKDRVLTGQLSGAVGTLAGMDERAFRVVERVMEILGLNVPDISWHSARDRFAEFLMVLSLIASSVARIANEIYQLQKTEIGELAEPWKKDNIGSSTMPHKRNPGYCSKVVALTRIIRANIPQILECMVGENERDLRIMISEWSLIAQTCIHADAVVSFGVYITSGLQINKEKMEQNLGCLNGLMLSERLMFLLGQKMGRINAHSFIHNICMQAVESGQTLLDLLLKEEIICKSFTKEELEAALDCHTYTGCADKYVELVCNQ